MEIDTIKISELAEGSTINNDSILVYNLNGQTKKITFQNLKNAVISALASEVSQLDADLETEVTARAAADTTLAGDISAEAAARTAADTALAGDISTETAARTAADTALASDIADNGKLIRTVTVSSNQSVSIAFKNAYLSCILMGFAQGIGTVVLLIKSISAGTNLKIIDMFTGSDFSNSSLTFSISGSNLVISSDNSNDSVFTVICANV